MGNVDPQCPKEFMMLDGRDWHRCTKLAGHGGYHLALVRVASSSIHSTVGTDASATVQW